MPKYNVYFMQTVRIFKNIDARNENHAANKIIKQEKFINLFKTTVLPWHIEAIKETEAKDFQPPIDNYINCVCCGTIVSKHRTKCPKCGGDPLVGVN
jgi:hypothetical protein